MIFTQTHLKEEGIFPERLKDLIHKSKSSKEDSLAKENKEQSEARMKISPADPIKFPFRYVGIFQTKSLISSLRIFCT